MRVRIPRNQDTNNNVENNETEQNENTGRRVVPVTPKLNMIITPREEGEEKKPKKKKGLGHTPNAVTQQNAMNLRVNEIFNDELKERGTDKRNNILFELTGRKFLETFNPKSIRKYVTVAVSNRLKKDVKDFIQFVIEKRTSESELSEKEALENLLQDVDTWAASCYKVDSPEYDSKEVEAYIEKMKNYAREEIEKRIKEIEINETKKQEESKPKKEKIKKKKAEKTTAKKEKTSKKEVVNEVTEELPIEEATPETRTEEIIPEEVKIEENVSESTTEQVEPEAQEQNETSVEKIANIGQNEEKAETKKSKKDAIIKKALKEVNIKPYRSGALKKETYFQEVLRFTDGFSFFCGDSTVYQSTTGYRETFKNLDNYTKFCALREQVQRIMNSRNVSEGIAMALLLNNPKANLDIQDRKILAKAGKKMRNAEYKKEIAEKTEKEYRSKSGYSEGKNRKNSSR